MIGDCQYDEVLNIADLGAAMPTQISISAVLKQAKIHIDNGNKSYKTSEAPWEVFSAKCYPHLNVGGLTFGNFDHYLIYIMYKFHVATTFH